MNQLTKVADSFRKMGWDDSFGSGIRGSFNSIGYAGKDWVLKYEGQEYPFLGPNNEPAPTIDVILLAANPAVSKMYYENAYDSGGESGGPPDCKSAHGEVPDDDSPSPQSKTCALCPHNKWGTQPNGRKGKACQDHKRTAVLLLPVVTKRMTGAPLNEAVALKIPPGSFSTWKKYMAELKDRNCQPFAGITRIGFAPASISNFQMTFKMVQMLEDADADNIAHLRDDETTMRLVDSDQPKVRLLEEVPFDPPKKIETGIGEAFGKKSTRPATIVPSPKSKLDVELAEMKGSTPGRRATQALQAPKPAPVPKAETQELAASDEEVGANEGLEPAGDELDAQVAEMMTTFTKK